MPSELVSVLVIMVLAALCVWGFKRINLPPILAYLVAGFVAGPSIFNLFPESAQMHVFAEIGIVFLLFSLGLEFSLPKLIAMRNLVFGVGFAQMGLTTVFVAIVAHALGLSLTASFVLGGMVGLSSTAIVIKQTSEMKILNTPRSQIAVAVLLFQDLAVVPFLIIIPLLGSGDVSIAQTIFLALGKGVIVVAGLLWFGRLVLPIIFREVASTRTDELFVLTAIIVALGAAGLTYGMGLSLALGAFLAGMMLSESRYRFQIEADIRPFRDILMGLFFITVGMRLEWTLIWPNTHWIMLGVVALIATKIILFRAATWIFKTPATDAWSAAFKLSQMGEFSFILAALAVSFNVFSADFAGIVVSIGVVSMALTPYMVNQSYRWAKALTPDRGADDISELPQSLESKHFVNHVILLGFGRVGQSAAKMLTMENIRYVAIDIDPIRVQEALQGSEDIIYGDVSDMSILQAANIDTAAAVVLTFDETHKAQQCISKVRQHYPKLPVIVRTKRDYDLEKLYGAGASQVVPELQEGSLMLVSQIYHYCGVPISRILKRIQAERKHHYNHLHGVFPGETTEVNLEKEDKLNFLHAVTMTATTWAVGKTIEACDCERHGVNVYSIRRGAEEIIEPVLDTVIEADDILVLSGRPRRIERAERKLLFGH